MLLTERHGTARNGTERQKLRFACLEWLNSESSFIFWMVILNLTASKVTYSFFLKGAYSFFRESLILGCDTAITFFTVITLDLFLYCILHRFKFIHKIAKIFFLSVSALMFSCDIFTLFYYQMPLNVNMIDVILMTNLRESSEFMQTYLINQNFLLFVSIIILFLFLMQKIFNVIFRYKILLIIIFLLAFCAGIFASVREIHNVNKNRVVNSIAVFRLKNLLSRTYEGRLSYQRMLDEAPEIHITKNKSTVPYVIFILGESTTRNHMSIYGYSLPTNPKLAARQRLYAFDDVISPHAATALSMQKIFTFYNNASKGHWFTYADLFRILNEAGYQTFWLSNQESVSVGPNKYYSNFCSSRKFTEDFKDNMYRGSSYDEAVLPFIDEAVHAGHDKNFYMIHLMGTHFHYHKRYPEDKGWDKFSADDEANTLSESQKTTRARYDNAILYNDYVVNEIIKRFEDKNAIVIYISDHGEDVFDSSNILLGHNEGTPSRFMIEIPFIIWLSEKFSASYPELEARIASSVHKPYMTDDMIHTVLDIMQIETPEYDPAKSIINASFDITRKRIYSGHLYDKKKGLIKIAVQ